METGWKTETRRLLGTPLFFDRSFLRHLAGWCAGALRADGDTRFFHETRLWYFTSFLWTGSRPTCYGSSDPGHSGVRFAECAGTVVGADEHRRGW